jgi:hypothetical protein
VKHPGEGFVAYPLWAPWGKKGKKTKFANHEEGASAMSKEDLPKLTTMSI